MTSLTEQDVEFQQFLAGLCNKADSKKRRSKKRPRTAPATTSTDEKEFCKFVHDLRKEAANASREKRQKTFDFFGYDFYENSSPPLVEFNHVIDVSNPDELILLEDLGVIPT